LGVVQPPSNRATPHIFLFFVFFFCQFFKAFNFNFNFF